MRRTVFVMAVLSVMVLVSTSVGARQGRAPLSHSAQVMPPHEVALLTLEEIQPDKLLAEDSAKAMAPGPLRFALPIDLQVSPTTHGTWEEVPGGLIWRLRVTVPGATDLNFGFGRYLLSKGATLHVASLDEAYFQGPYTAADNRDHGQLWTPVIPGASALIELFVPAGAEAELELVRVGRGYRDLFKRNLFSHDKQGSCNIDVICPLGDGWRDQIRSVAVYGTNGSTFCTGTLLNNVRQDNTPYFLTANHCGITSSNAASVVVYWNYESPTCGALSGGTLNQSTSGATFRASDYANDMTLIQLSSQPSSAYNVYYSGWDARTSVTPQSSIGIHHPNTDEKAISYNDDPLTTGNSCINTGGTNSHWWVDNWEQGTTEPGSSGSGLWDPGTHRLVGYLSGGQAACGNSQYDCFGKFAVGWGLGLSTWLDPDSTGTMYVDGKNPGGSGNLAPTAGFTSSVTDLTVSFNDTSTDSDGSVVAWSWTFGDGGTSSSQNPSHTYSAAGTYTVALTVTDDDGATGSTSHQVTVSSAGVTELSNGVPVSGLSGSQGTWKHYRINLPANASDLEMQIAGGSGDADLYTRFGAQPTSSTYDCRPYKSGNNETCSVASPQQGYYYLSIHAYSAYSSVTLEASYGSLSNQPPTANFTSSTSGLTVSFTNTSTDSDGSVVAWSWTFGDGGTSSSQSPSHTYSSAGTYTVGLTVTDDDGATGSTSKSVTVSTSGVTELSNNVPVGGLSGSQGTWKHYRVDVPSGASDLVMQISGGSGDADLYTRFGAQPTSSTYDCRPYKSGNNESCSVASPQQGYYYLSIHAYSAYSSVAIEASYSEGGGSCDLQDGVPISGLSASQGSWVRYCIDVPAGSSNLEISISGGSGDADLYTRFGAEPSTSVYDCRPYKYGNNETCTVSSPQAGIYYIGIRAYSAFSSVTLEGSYD